VGRFAVAVYREWKHDNAPLLAAAVAFYATFSLAPLLVLIVRIAAEVLGPEAARTQVVDVIARFVNPRTAVAVQRLLAPASADDGTGVTIVSGILLLIGASGVFRQLRVALNLVLDVPTVESRDWKTVLRGRLIAVLMVVVTLALLLSSVVLTAVLAAVRNFVPEIPAGDVAIWQLLDMTLTTMLVAGVFAAILKFVPDAKLEWRHVRVAAFAGAVLFGIGRYLLGVYISNTNIASLYGAAASLFVVLVATFFAVLVLFLSAELTEVMARRDSKFTEERARAQAEHDHAQRKPNVPEA
jgi:membrane protein